MPTEVEFVPESHEYRLNGRVMLSVTQILKRAGYLRAYAGMNPMYADRGTSVHLATEFEDKGTLDLDALDRRIVPYLEQYRDFKSTTGVVIEAIEERFVDEAKGYAGTRDRRVKIGSKRGVLDIKTGRPAPWHPLQTAGYAEPLVAVVGSSGPRDAEGEIVCRWALYLDGIGKFKLVEHTDPLDFIEWNGALVVAKGQRRRGIE